MLEYLVNLLFPFWGPRFLVQRVFANKVALVVPKFLGILVEFLGQTAKDNASRQCAILQNHEKAQKVHCYEGSRDCR